MTACAPQVANFGLRSSMGYTQSSCGVCNRRSVVGNDPVGMGFVIDGLDRMRHGMQAEALAHPCGIGHHGSEFRLVRRHLHHLVRKRLFIRCHQGRGIRAEHFGNAADIARDDRLSGGERLKNDIGKASARDGITMVRPSVKASRAAIPGRKRI